MRSTTSGRRRTVLVCLVASLASLGYLLLVASPRLWGVVLVAAGATVLVSSVESWRGSRRGVE